MRALIENEQQAHVDQGAVPVTSPVNALIGRAGISGPNAWSKTAQGRVRLLTAIDGQPLSPQRAQQEHDRLMAIAADPADFIRHEQAMRSDEEHARHLLELLPVDFSLR